MRWLAKGKFKLFRDQTGLTILEALTALGILGFIGVAFITALNTTSKSTSLYEQRATAANLAQSQIHEIKAMDYDPNGNYPVSVTLPPSYIMSISTVEPEVSKQEVTAVVHFGEHFLFQLTTVKINQ